MGDIGGSGTRRMSAVHGAFIQKMVQDDWYLHFQQATTYPFPCAFAQFAHMGQWATGEASIDAPGGNIPAGALRQPVVAQPWEGLKYLLWNWSEVLQLLEQLAIDQQNLRAIRSSSQKLSLIHI